MFLILILAVLAVAGCAGSSNNPATPGVSNATGTPTVAPLSAANAPKNYSDLYDLGYLWGSVNDVNMLLGTFITDSNNMTPLMAMDVSLSNASFNGTSARELREHVYRPAGAPAGDENAFGMDMSVDLFLTHDPADLKLLGGHTKLLFYNDPDMNYEGDIDPRMLAAELTGKGSQMNDAISEDGLSSDLFQEEDTNPDESHDYYRLNLSQVLSLDVGDYNALNGQFGEVNTSVFNLRFNGIETLKVGGKDYQCYNVTFAPGEEDMTFWYCPQFPAMPVKYIIPHEDTPMVFRVEGFR
jgi:hypothetical protein